MTDRINALVRSNILAMAPYSSARDEYSDVSDAVLLDANENPFSNGLNRYPDPYQKVLKKRISEIKDVLPERIFLGNGSDEAIDLLFRVFCEPGVDNIVIPDPTYGMYQVSAAIQNIEVRKVPMTKDFQLQADEMISKTGKNTKLLFICNPNNPSGNQINSIAIESIIKDFNGIVVIDEAYIDFSKGKSFTEKIDEYENLVILQTFSKAWGMAGLRLGMAFSNEYIIHLLNKVKAPYNLSITTQNTALNFIKDEVSIKENIDLLLSQREWLEAELKKINLVENIYPSDTNFLLIKFKNHESVFDALTKAGIIVRDRSKALHCERCLRLTVGTEEENNQLIQILKDL